MYSITAYVVHSYPDGMDDDDFRVEFNSLNDALMWASFYDGKSDERDAPEYTRHWGVRAIYRDGTPLNLTSTDYIHSDLSWDEIDALTV